MHESSPAINPFAAPQCVADRSISDRAESNRAPERVLLQLCNRLAIAEVGYALGCASFFAASFWDKLPLSFSSNAETLSLFYYLTIAFFGVTWICLFSIHRVVQGWIGAIGMLITFPIPLIGTFISRGESVHVNVFLRHNGYQRTFLGAKPNPEERQRMESDPNYKPSLYFDNQGARHSKRVFTLSDASIVAMIGFFAMSIALI